MDISSLDHTIRRFLFELGFLSSYQGYRYLFDAFKLCAQDHSYIYDDSNKLLNVISARHGKNVHTVKQAVYRVFMSKTARQSPLLKKIMRNSFEKPGNLSIHQFIIQSCVYLHIV